MKTLTEVRKFSIKNSHRGVTAISSATREVFSCFETKQGIYPSQIRLIKEFGYFAFPVPFSPDALSASARGSVLTVVSEQQLFCYQRLSHDLYKECLRTRLPGLDAAVYDEQDKCFYFVRSSAGQSYAGVLNEKGVVVAEAVIENDFNRNTPFIDSNLGARVVGAKIRFENGGIKRLRTACGGNGMEDFYLRFRDKGLLISQPVEPAGKYSVFIPKKASLRVCDAEFTSVITGLQWGTDRIVKWAATSGDQIYITLASKPAAVFQYRTG